MNGRKSSTAISPTHLFQEPGELLEASSYNRRDSSRASSAVSDSSLERNEPERGQTPSNRGESTHARPPTASTSGQTEKISLAAESIALLLPRLGIKDAKR